MSTESTMTTIEINGVKMEVDLRHAKRIDELRIGDRVKVLTKDYASSFTVHAGVIIGFEPFVELPTIIIAYVPVSYTGADLKFLHFNAKSKDVEVVKAIDDDELDLSEADVMGALGREKEKLLAQVAELDAKAAYIRTHFRAYWGQVHSEAEEA